MPDVHSPHLILYDADCGFCRWSLAWILRWDRRRRLEPLALQEDRATELLAPTPEAERMASWHLIAPDGSRASAGAAAGPLLRLLPGGQPLAALLEAAPGLTERAYGWVVANRGRLGRALGERARARADATIARRRPGP